MALYGYGYVSHVPASMYMCMYMCMQPADGTGGRCDLVVTTGGPVTVITIDQTYGLILAAVGNIIKQVYMYSCMSHATCSTAVSCIQHVHVHVRTHACLMPHVHVALQSHVYNVYMYMTCTCTYPCMSHATCS